MNIKTLSATLAILGSGVALPACGGDKAKPTDATEVQPARVEAPVKAEEAKPEPAKPEPAPDAPTPANAEGETDKGEMACGEGKCGEGKCGKGGAKADEAAPPAPANADKTDKT